ncbi:hypothetical protein HK405_008632 [Cladochytrium tenue]|nr:hypothetical protein HK405_008632 [Cladochytrium tenue]
MADDEGNPVPGADAVNASSSTSFVVGAAAAFVRLQEDLSAYAAAVAADPIAALSATPPHLVVLLFLAPALALWLYFQLRTPFQANSIAKVRLGARRWALPRHATPADALADSVRRLARLATRPPPQQHAHPPQFAAATPPVRRLDPGPASGSSTGLLPAKRRTREERSLANPRQRARVVRNSSFVSDEEETPNGGDAGTSTESESED